MHIQLQAGRVCGVERQGVIAFIGMPYAQAGRFEAPRPVSWDGELAADRWGPDAPQNAGETFARAGVPQGEDCLRINVWTPDTQGSRPVLFWIHGGAYVQGASSVLNYDGAELARRGDVVVVSINYRLGALGFAYHPELAREDGSSGNWGLCDQIAALQWVRREIAAFGGSASDVTVFGESAGAGSVSLLLVSPEARGLFQRAICQSGSPHVVSTRYVQQGTEQLAAALGVGIAGLKTAAISDLLRAQRDVQQKSRANMVFLPVVDGSVVPCDPLAVFADGQAAPVPLLMGTNADEYRLFAPLDPHSRELSDELLHERVSSLVTGGVQEIVETYRTERAARGLGVRNTDVWYAIKTDQFFRVGARQVLDRHSRHQRSYTYLFCYGSPRLDGWMGAAHGLEISFVFGTHGLPGVTRFTGAGPRADAVCEHMLRSWVAFARTGDPSTPALPWPAYDAETRPTLRIDAECSVEHAPAEREIRTLERYLKP